MSLLIKKFAKSLHSRVSTTRNITVRRIQNKKISKLFVTHKRYKQFYFHIFLLEICKNLYCIVKCRRSLSKNKSIIYYLIHYETILDSFGHKVYFLEYYLYFSHKFSVKYSSCKNPPHFPLITNRWCFWNKLQLSYTMLRLCIFC